MLKDSCVALFLAYNGVFHHRTSRLLHKQHFQFSFHDEVAMNIRFFFPIAFGALFLCGTTLNGQVTTVSSFDFVDDFLSPDPGTLLTVTNGETFDALDGNTGMLGADGINDFRISWSTTGLGDDGNNVDWASTVNINDTGIRSTINPTFINGGGVTINDFGHLVTQTIQIDFLSGVIIEADDVTDFGWSSGNTAGIVYESSVVEYLDVNGNPFSTFPTFDYDSPLDGTTGTGTSVAGTAGSVIDVGTDLSAEGVNGPDDNLSTSGIGLGIPAGTVLGGVRITHRIEDVRGVNNGDTVFTNTINDFDLVNFEASAIPEPSSCLALVGLGLACFSRRKRRASLGDFEIVTRI